MPKQIAFRLDDACSTPGHGLAQADLLRGGIVKNAAVMVCGESFDDTIGGIAEAKRERGDAVNIGLHLMLNCEWRGLRWTPAAPAGRVPSLVDEHGLLTSTPHVLYDRGGIAIDELLIEADAQLARLREAGIDPDYVDEHMDFQWTSKAIAPALHGWANDNGLFYAQFQPLSMTHERHRQPDGSHDLGRFVNDLAEGPAVAVFHAAYATPFDRALVIEASDDPPGKTAAERQADVDVLTSEALRSAVERGEVEPLTLLEVERRRPSRLPA